MESLLTYVAITALVLLVREGPIPLHQHSKSQPPILEIPGTPLNPSPNQQSPTFKHVVYKYGHILLRHLAQYRRDKLLLKVKDFTRSKKPGDTAAHGGDAYFDAYLLLNPEGIHEISSLQANHADNMAAFQDMYGDTNPEIVLQHADNEIFITALNQYGRLMATRDHKSIPYADFLEHFKAIKAYSLGTGPQLSDDTLNHHVNQMTAIFNDLNHNPEWLEENHRHDEFNSAYDRHYLISTKRLNRREARRDLKQQPHSTQSQKQTQKQKQTQSTVTTRTLLEPIPEEAEEGQEKELAHAQPTTPSSAFLPPEDDEQDGNLPPPAIINAPASAPNDNDNDKSTPQTNPSPPQNAPKPIKPSCSSTSSTSSSSSSSSTTLSRILGESLAGREDIFHLQGAGEEVNEFNEWMVETGHFWMSQESISFRKANRLLVGS